MSRATMRAAGEAVPTETRDIIDAIDLLCRAINMNELIVMAGESTAMGDARDTVTTGCGVVDEMLKEVKAVLYATVVREGENATRDRRRERRLRFNTAR